ncbi:protein of unknown function [Candidatus Hydrogenisulfobacillus filiaventi]|uniref:AAA+ ATPase domain-containing protein n=1 Tax=Candidatus Hydrogenisulfobacillus filiaventi TaxID=2707344 RepID=A0A6F8ZHR9_9FIRM|nr:protein of unknown function [Candidatus Hydrogenisulfobacillus filiaventi]
MAGSTWRRKVHRWLREAAASLSLPPLRIVRIVGDLREFREMDAGFWRWMAQLPEAASWVADEEAVWLNDPLDVVLPAWQVVWFHHADPPWGLARGYDVWRRKDGELSTPPAEIVLLLTPVAAPLRDADRALAAWRGLLMRWMRDQGGIGIDGVERPPSGPPRVILPEPMRREIWDDVRRFFRSASEYRRLGLPHRRGVLFTGPPGNGKTTTAHALLLETPGVYRMVRILTRDTADTDLVEWFRVAGEMAPSMLVLEDLDAVRESRASRSTLLNLLDGMDRRLEGVYVIATTNYPDLVDPGLFLRPGRFDRVFRFPNPGPEWRDLYLRERFGDALLDEERRAVVAASEGMPVSALTEIGLLLRWLALEEGGLAEDPRTVVDRWAAAWHRRRREHEGDDGFDMGFRAKE